jgi:hypothetical protein
MMTLRFDGEAGIPVVRFVGALWSRLICTPATLIVADRERVPGFTGTV